MKFSEPAAEPGYAARGPGERPVGVEGLRAVDVRPQRAAAFGEPSGVRGSAETHGRGDVKTGTSGSAAHPGTDGPPLTELLAVALSEEAWESFSRGSAIRRAGRAGFARNVCVAMGNWLSGSDESDEAVTVLGRALSDPKPLVRGHAAWALGQAGSVAAREYLASRLESEGEPWVREEVALSLEG